MAFKKRNLLILILFISNFFYCAILRGTPPGGNPAEVFVVVVSSLQRVLQDEVDISGAGEAEVFCAKGESESFQIIVANDTGRDLPDIDLRSATWRYVGAKPVGVPVLQMFREHYVKIGLISSRSKSRVGMHPDALIPFVNPYTGQRIKTAKYLASGQDVKAENNQGYWVDVSVGRDVKAGIYTNEITVLSAGKEIAVVPVKVTVWDFELPEVHKLKTYIGAIRDVSVYYGLSKNSLAYRAIVKRYRLMLRDHGAPQRFQVEPKVNHRTGEVSFTPQFVKSLKDYTDEMHPSITRATRIFSSEPVKRARYLSSWEAFLRSNPWIPEPIILFDEPDTKEKCLAAIEYGKSINTYAPSIKFFVSAPVRPGQPELPSLEGVVDIYVPPWFWATPQQVKKWQKEGGEVWSYSHGDNRGIPVWLIDFPLLDYRIPAWFSWSLDLKGIFYWQTMSWSKRNIKIAPWVDCKGIVGNRFSYGEGFLVYPGRDAGVAGPIASMRLKVFRDGVEDFDYFAALAKLAGRDEADRIVKNVASSFRTYSRNPSDYTEARKLIAKKILEKMQD